MELAKAILMQANGSSHKVCRNIFGSVDHEGLKADFEEFLKSTTEEAKQRWNFDFASETPLEGTYKWEKVVYLKSDTINEDNNQTTCAMDSKKEDGYPESCNILSLHELRQDFDSSESTCGKRKQKLITDFYHVKRRCLPSPPSKDYNP